MGRRARGCRPGFRDGINTLACIEMLERGNSEDVIKKVERTPDALLACTLIRDALLDRLLITVVRAYGPIHKGDFHLRVAFKELDRREPDDELPIDVDGTALSDAIALWKEVGTDHRQKQLEHFRNKVVAHHSQRNPDISAPLIKDLMDSVDIPARYGRDFPLRPVPGSFNLKCRTVRIGKAPMRFGPIGWAK